MGVYYKRNKVPFANERLQIGQKMHVYIWQVVTIDLANPTLVFKWENPSYQLQRTLGMQCY